MTKKDFYTAAYKDYVKDKFKTIIQLWGSTRKAAEHYDITYSYISRLANGKEVAPPDTMMKIFPEDIAYILELLGIESKGMRLIDADELLEQMEELYQKRSEESYMTGSRGACVTWNDAVICIKDSPTIIPEPSDIRPIDGQIRGELDVSTGKVRYFYANKLKKVNDILNGPKYYRTQENSNTSVTVEYDINDISEVRDTIKLVLKYLEAENEDPSGQDA